MIGALAGSDHPAAGALITDRSWFDRSALEVAPELLGMELIHDTPEGPITGRLVEVEAYQGPEDLAAHSSRGRTARNAVMFGAPGHLYVYLIYGMYHCFNVVTCPEGRAAAVLVRGLEPLEGIERGARTDGPGRLCRAMGIHLGHNRLDLLGDRLFLEDGPAVPPARVARGPRIGVDYSGHWAQKPYRLWEVGNPHVSRQPRSSARSQA